MPPLSYSKLATLLRLGGKVQRYFKTKCVAHNHVILTQLPQYIRTQLNRFRNDEGYRQYSVDYCLLLGDLVTWANPASFKFFVEYLTQSSVRYKTKRGVWKHG